MDRIFIKDLEVETVVGIYDWEREIRQKVVLNLEMSADIARAAQTTLAERCSDIILNEFGVAWLTLQLDKPGAVTGSKSVGVMIERGRKP
ncbi:MAG: dihydroneopterin aldolase [Xanthomonadaceae bacterium]|nr:dihydroneopterin aldolase [Xanthomonadaceae bacterium]